MQLDLTSCKLQYEVSVTASLRQGSITGDKRRDHITPILRPLSSLAAVKWSLTLAACYVK